jgi:hypothetical protein
MGRHVRVSGDEDLFLETAYLLISLPWCHSLQTGVFRIRAKGDAVLARVGRRAHRGVAFAFVTMTR